MKFVYEYRTSDNVKHNGEVNAANKDAAFAILKKQGIRPSRFAEAPGLLNKLFGKGKRWMLIAFLGVLCILLFASARHYASRSALASDSPFDSRLRRQVIGDSAAIEIGIRTGWSGVFPEEGERFLASFAIPGVPAGQRTTSEAEISAALARRVDVEDGDSIEARQIKAMVEGMKDELRSFLSCGGSVAQYGRLLVRRQEDEIGYYNRAKNEVETAAKSGTKGSALVSLWESRNAKLRSMGIKLVPLPE